MSTICIYRFTDRRYAPRHPLKAVRFREMLDITAVMNADQGSPSFPVPPSPGRAFEQLARSGNPLNWTFLAIELLRRSNTVHKNAAKTGQYPYP